MTPNGWLDDNGFLDDIVEGNAEYVEPALDQGIDAPLPASQEVVVTNASIQERVANLEARERRLQEWEADLQARERRLVEDLERRYRREMAGQAAAPRAAPDVLRAHEEAAEKTRAAIMSVEVVEEAGGGEALGNTRRLLEEGPCAKSAASALLDLVQVAKSCDQGGS